MGVSVGNYILMTRSGTFVYMRYASTVGLLPWELGHIHKGT